VTRRQLLFRVVPLIAAPLCFLALAEGALALLGLPRDSDDPNFGEMVRRIDADEFFYAVDPELFWRLQPSMTVRGEATSFRTNAHGLRGPELPRRGSDVRVVLSMGDSVTFGYGLAAADTYPVRLEAELLDALGPGVRVVNAGVPGYSSHQGRAALPDLLERLSPEVVVISYGFNDARNLFASDEAVSRAGRMARVARQVLWKSRLYRALRILLIAPPRLREAPDGPEVARVDVPRYVENLSAMVAAVRAAGATPVLLATPFEADTLTPYGPEWFSLHTPIARYRDAARTLAEESGVPFVPVDPLTEAHAPGNHHLFLDPAHPNPDGIEIMVAALAPVVTEALTPAR